MSLDNEKVLQRLDVIISLLIPPFEESKYSVKGLGIEILKLCDFRHSTADIIKAVKKPRQAVDNALSKLRSQGIIVSVPKDSGTYYMRLK